MRARPSCAPSAAVMCRALRQNSMKRPSKTAFYNTPSVWYSTNYAVRYVLPAVTSFLGAVLFLTTSFVGDVTAGIIPPPWVDAARNPCAKESWQLLYWPMDGKCYRIFQRGPCRESFELVFDAKSGAAECRCPHHFVMWTGDGKCYKEFTRGPCGSDEFLEPSSSPTSIDSGLFSLSLARNDSRTQTQALCVKKKPCPEGWLFWPADGQCYANYTRGPCFKGDLLYQDPETGDAKCGCESSRMPRFYWAQSFACYEHFTTGPCNEGYLFIHNRTARQVQCTCNANLTAHYHPRLGECHPLNVQGPCARGQWYVFSAERRRPECQCRPQHTPWPSSSREGGVCHREYTRGPCGAAEAIIHNATTGSGACTPIPCKPGQLYFPHLKRCFKIGTRGPCPAGKLVMYEPYHRSTHRGICACSKDLTHNYWLDTGECFETETRGPCSDLEVYKYNATLGRTECRCEQPRGNSGALTVGEYDGKCYKVGAQGPCRRNEVLDVVPPTSNATVSSTDTGVIVRIDTVRRRMLECRCKKGFAYSDRYDECMSERSVRLFGSRKLLKT